jgi:hypothetical protein
MLHSPGDPNFSAWGTGVDEVLAGKLDTTVASSTYLAGTPATNAGSKNVKASTSTTVGPLADMFTLFGGSDAYPHSVGNAILSFLSGYDNHVWNASIANVDQGHHCVSGPAGGHATICGGSNNLNFGTYSSIGGGTGNTVMDDYSNVAGGRSNAAGVSGYTSLTVQANPGDTTITTSLALVAGQKVVIGQGAAFDLATVASVAGSVATLTGFQSVASTDNTGASTGTSLGYVHLVGVFVLFTTGIATDSAVMAGQNNRAMAQRAFVGGGYNNQAYGVASAILGGDSNIVKAAYGTARGKASSTHFDYAHSMASGQLNAQGDAQVTDVSIMGKTTDATPKEIGPNQLLGGIVLNLNTTMGFRVSLVAHNTTTHAPVGRIVLEGIINRVGSVSTTNIFGTVTKVVNDANLAGLDANATANVTAGALKIMVTGIAATNLNWVGRVSLEEVGG